MTVSDAPNGGIIYDCNIFILQASSVNVNKLLFSIIVVKVK
jgi:hypothetical protein